MRCLSSKTSFFRRRLARARDTRREPPWISVPRRNIARGQNRERIDERSRRFRPSAPRHNSAEFFASLTSSRERGRFNGRKRCLRRERRARRIYDKLFTSEPDYTERHPPPRPSGTTALANRVRGVGFPSRFQVSSASRRKDERFYQFMHQNDAHA